MTTVDYTYGMPRVTCCDTIEQVFDAAASGGVQILNSPDWLPADPDVWYDFDIIHEYARLVHLRECDDFFPGFFVYGPMDHTEIMSVEVAGVRKIVEARPYVLHLPGGDHGPEGVHADGTQGVWLQVNVEL